MTNPETLQQLWTNLLDQLRLQMTRASFEAWLLDSHLVAVEPGGRYVIRAKSSQAREWLEIRLAGLIKQRLSALVGSEVVLQFITTPASKPALLPPAAILPADLINGGETGGSLVAGLDFEQLWLKTGFTQIPDYAIRYWRIYLGRAFDLWEYLISEDKRDIRLMLQKKIPYWTPPRRYTYRSLAGMLGCSRSTLTGRLSPCHWYPKAQPADQPPACCGRHRPTLIRPNRAGRPQCLYWLEGMLEQLCREGLIAVEGLGQKDKPRAHELRLQAWRLVPLLSPAQVAQFRTDLDRERHRDWLERYSHLGQLDPARWERITLPSLVPYMPGYDWGRELSNRYVNNPFILSPTNCFGHK